MARKNAFDLENPYKLSRSKMDLFRQCPRCFYYTVKHGISVPSGPPFTLNNAVDELWKKEFDCHRDLGTPHPIAIKHSIDAIPFKSDFIDDWRNNRRGLTFLHEPTRFLVMGAPDEIWVTPSNELIVIDVKATSKSSEINLDADWQISYKQQVEVYQWLLRKNGYQVSNTAYFIYCNGKKDESSSGTRLEFEVSLIPYEGTDSWIELALLVIRECLVSDSIPEAGPDCKQCKYCNAVSMIHN